MIIDEKGKLFGKINLVDLLVILVILVGILGIFFTKTKLKEEKVLVNDSNMLISSSQNLDKLSVHLLAQEVRDVTRDAIVVGDSVYLAKTDKLIGTITEVESKPAMRNVTADDGTVYRAEVPERYDVTIMVEVDGKLKEDGYYTASNLHLLYGKDIEIKTSTVLTNPKIDKIVLLEE